MRLKSVLQFGAIVVSIGFVGWSLQLLRDNQSMSQSSSAMTLTAAVASSTSFFGEANIRVTYLPPFGRPTSTPRGIASTPEPQGGSLPADGGNVVALDIQGDPADFHTPTPPPTVVRTLPSPTPTAGANAQNVTAIPLTPMALTNTPSGETFVQVAYVPPSGIAAPLQLQSIRRAPPSVVRQLHLLTTGLVLRTIEPTAWQFFSDLVGIAGFLANDMPALQPTETATPLLLLSNSTFTAPVFLPTNTPAPARPANQPPQPGGNQQSGRPSSSDNDDSSGNPPPPTSPPPTLTPPPPTRRPPNTPVPPPNTPIPPPNTPVPPPNTPIPPPNTPVPPPNTLVPPPNTPVPPPDTPVPPPDTPVPPPPPPPPQNTVPPDIGDVVDELPIVGDVVNELPDLGLNSGSGRGGDDDAADDSSGARGNANGNANGNGNGNGNANGNANGNSNGNS